MQNELNNLVRELLQRAEMALETMKNTDDDEQYAINEGKTSAYIQAAKMLQKLLVK